MSHAVLFMLTEKHFFYFQKILTINTRVECGTITTLKDEFGSKASNTLHTEHRTA